MTLLQGGGGGRDVTDYAKSFLVIELGNSRGESIEALHIRMTRPWNAGSWWFMRKIKALTNVFLSV